MSPANPFFFESPSDRWSFTNRDELLPALVALLRQRGRRLLIHGRRRMGKTSLIQNAAGKAGRVFLYVDLSTAASLADVARRLLETAPEEEKGMLARALAIAKKHFKSFAVTAGKVVLSGDFRQAEGEQTLEQVLGYIDERAALDDQPWTVCLDEFQDVRTLGGDRADWKIRGIIQGHRHLNYIFTGSDHRLVKWMTEPTAAFFKQLQQMEVGPIDPAHLARWIDRRARTGGLPDASFGAAVVAAAGPCTGDIVRLAKVTFDIAAKGRAADPVAGAVDSIALVELNAEFVARWADLSVGQRSLLQAIVAGRPPTAADTLREYGIRTASTAQSALERMLEKQILIRENDTVQFDSPFFRRWVGFNGGESAARLITVN
ncbi:MAG TPA: hypothetical protein VHD32_08310 [Candidatus Didemnitutus sp.]|nr:hypothetical protein [Candidatus Didemnitutus sp.]